MTYNSKCYDARPCFGRRKATGNCIILTSTYKDGMCPFCKPHIDRTKGKVYPFDPDYQKWV